MASLQDRLRVITAFSRSAELYAYAAYRLRRRLPRPTLARVPDPFASAPLARRPLRRYPRFTNTPQSIPRVFRFRSDTCDSGLDKFIRSSIGRSKLGARQSRTCATCAQIPSARSTLESPHSRFDDVYSSREDMRNHLGRLG